MATVHPTRTRKRRPTEGQPHLVVLHTSEQLKATVTSAQSLAAFIATPKTATNTASYHYGVDLDDVVPLVPEEDIAFHAPPNWRGIGICLTGAAARDWTGVTDGVDDTPELELAAVLVADICRRHGFPVRHLTIDQMLAGEQGICGHVDVSQAWDLSDHTDPGIGFPWTSFLARVQALLTPPPPTPPTQETDEMTPELIRFKGYWNEILETSGGPIHGSNEQVVAWRQLYGVPAAIGDPGVTAGKKALVINPADQPAKFKSTLVRLGLTVADLSVNGGV